MPVNQPARYKISIHHYPESAIFLKKQSEKAYLTMDYMEYFRVMNKSITILRLEHNSVKVTDIFKPVNTKSWSTGCLK